MKYVYTNDPINKAAAYLSEIIVNALKDGQRVLWLLSGGSSIPIAIKASVLLKDTDLSKLYMSMTDERYGPVGHSDENWQQLLDCGLKLQNANYYRPLDNSDINQTTNSFDKWLVEQFQAADTKIGIFGIGIDGHTCGIKPHSPALNSSSLASHFTGDDFKRITITAKAVEQIDYAIIQVSGLNKKPALSQLLNQEISPTDMPSQLLKRVPYATLFTDIKKEDI